mmetsp:Transcript_9781/g.24743  ORF Transcript_9781/g.24743 Transcript_9781/m.24743 type:complete len:201 (-) Transcript_9781:243-845(-)
MSSTLMVSKKTSFVHVCNLQSKVVSFNVHWVIRVGCHGVKCFSELALVSLLLWHGCKHEIAPREGDAGEHVPLLFQPLVESERLLLLHVTADDRHRARGAAPVAACVRAREALRLGGKQNVTILRSLECDIRSVVRAALDGHGVHRDVVIQAWTLSGALPRQSAEVHRTPSDKSRSRVEFFLHPQVHGTVLLVLRTPLFC